MKKVFYLSLNDAGLKLLDADVKKCAPIAKKDKSVMESQLDKLIKEGGELDASQILKVVSPQNDFDIFISHHRADEEKARKIALCLEKRGYKPFIDSQYWLHYDTVAEKLNNYHYHKDPNGNMVYDHSKTKTIQKHCDVLLLSALSNVMCKCKYCIFIEPPEKMIGIQNYSSFESKLPKTYSPWIYWEIIFAGMLIENRKLTEDSLQHYEVPNISYGISTKNMIKISIEDILFKRFETKL